MLSHVGDFVFLYLREGERPAALAIARQEYVGTVYTDISRGSPRAVVAGGSGNLIRG